MKLKFKIYSLSLLSLFIVSFTFLANFNSLILWEVLFFGFLILIAEHLNIDLKNNSGISVSFAIIMAAALLLGYTGATLVALFASVIFEDIKNKKSIYVLLFNGAQYGLATLISSYTLVQLLTYVGITNSIAIITTLSGVLIMCLSAVLFFFINTASVHYFIKFKNGDSHLWSNDLNIASLGLNYLAMIPLAIVLSKIYLNTGVFGLIMMVAPFMIIRHMFLTYMQSHENAASIIKTLTSAIEAKDKYTRQHSERVASYAHAIASSMSMPEKELVELNYAAYLHDIGKMAVQSRVLNKPQKLTDVEFNMMKRHPAVGHRIVNQIEMLKHVSEPILKHHEFINGKGYPLGTTDLPLSARIIAVADAFDAMTSLRPYRQPLSLDQAFSELDKNAGTQFDPVIIEYLKKGLAYDDQDKMKHDKPTATKLQLQLDIAV